MSGQQALSEYGGSAWERGGCWENPWSLAGEEKAGRDAVAVR